MALKVLDVLDVVGLVGSLDGDVEMITRPPDATLVVSRTPSVCRRNACYHVGVGLGV